MNTNHETIEPVRYNKQAYYHYRLDLDDEGRIVGGRYYSDSNHIDMLWAPLQPIQGGKKGNERGNPHVDVKEVLAIWRASVSEEVRNQWLNIDPTDEDRIVEANATPAKLGPKNDETKAPEKDEEKKDESTPVSTGDASDSQ